MDFELRQLRHARALAEHGSFARAARTLHLTQPALSRSIQELERRTGIALFDRSRGRVEPTDLGRVFLGQARELLARAESLDRDVATMRGSGRGAFVVGSGTFPTSLFMAQAVAAFLKGNPGVGIRLVNDNWISLVAALRRRELDFVVASPPLEDEAADLEIQPLSAWQARFLVRPGHPLLDRGELTLADIAAQKLVTTSRLSPAIVEQLLGARRRDDVRRALPDVACESPAMMATVTAATDHVQLSALVAHAADLESGRLVALPFVDPRLTARFAVLRLRARTLAPIADELIGKVVDADRAAVAQDHALAARLSPPAAAAARRATPRSLAVR